MIWTSQQCLVTGGASFIGSHLVEKLVSLGANVRVIDNLSSGKEAYLNNVKDKIDFLKGDLMSTDVAIASMENIDRVFHLAADHGGRGYIASHPANCIGNMALDYNVFRAAAESDVEHVTFASSACVYPTDLQDEKTLLKESMVSFEQRGGAFADEEYGWAKLMGELSLRAHFKQFGLKGAIARLSTVYGPRENESHALVALIAKAFIEQSPFEIWGDGNQTRGFTYVDDIVDGLILASEKIEDVSAINLGTDEFISLNQIASAIFSQVNWVPPLGINHQTNKPVGVLHRALDYSLTTAKTGWQPKTDIADGIAKTADWYYKNNDISAVKSVFEQALMSR